MVASAKSLSGQITYLTWDFAHLYYCEQFETDTSVCKTSIGIRFFASLLQKMKATG